MPTYFTGVFCLSSKAVLRNASDVILITLSGITISARFEQLRKAHLSIFSKLLDNKTSERFVQFSKAQPLIYLTVSGIVTFSIIPSPEKASKAIPRVPSFNTTFAV